MLERCFDEKVKERCPTYENVTCCKEWLSYKNFEKWFNSNYYEVKGERMALDKDILFKGNKIYSPETCIFVSTKINSIFTKNNSNRGNFPIGVIYRPDINKTNPYNAQCSTLKENKQISLGYFKTPEEAFNAYKTFKENYIKQIADEYKPYIPRKLYEAMYRYEVEITD